jgi:endogenous inhibitor of DNA gyrase (YacG/DUF329 family)
MTQAKCPICGKTTTAAHKPFCSQRCAYVDLSQWLSGGYRIPTDEAPTVYEGDPDRFRDEAE